jgi:hypothetical protein
MPVEYLIIKLRQYRFWLAAIWIISFGISYYYLHYYNKHYKAEAVFLISDADLTDVSLSEREMAGMIKYNSINSEKFFRFLYSDQLIANVDKKLSLSEHYHLDKTEKHFDYHLSNAFTRHVKATQIGLSIMSMVVTDKDADFAAALAESIVYEIKEINRNVAVDAISERLNVLLTIQNEIKESYVVKMDTLITALNQLSSHTADKFTSKDYLELKYSILNSSSKVDALATKLEDVSRIYSVYNKMLKANGLDKLFVLNRKYYQSRKEDILIDLSIAFVISLVMLSLTIFLGHQYHQHKDLCRLFWKGK